jgi:rubrerythrin
MGKNDDMKYVTNSIKCLIVFEHKTAQLYEDIAEQTRNLPLVKSLLLQISLDSQKHSVILKGLAQSLPKTDRKPNDLPKAFTEAWRSIDAFQMELSDVDEILEADLVDLPRQLSSLEIIMSEAYDILVRYQNLELISSELGKIYVVNLESLKKIFMEIIHDEEHHKEILMTIKELLGKKQEEKEETAPEVRYQNPDAWGRAIPTNTQA